MTDTTYKNEFMLTERDCEVCGVEYVKLMYSETEQGFSLIVEYSDSIDTMRATEQSKPEDVEAVLADAHNSVKNAWGISGEEINEDDVLAPVYSQLSSEEKRELDGEIDFIAKRIKNR
jgi:hypothetical protein